MANPLITLMKNLFVDTTNAAKEGNSDKLAESKSKLQNLQIQLDVQFRTIAAELERENKALFTRPSEQRMFYFKNAQLIKKRLNLVGNYKMSVGKALQTIQAAQDQIKFAEELKKVQLDPSLVGAAQEKLIAAQTRVSTCLTDMNQLVSTIDSNCQAIEAMTGMAAPSTDDQKIQELLDRADTCMAAGDEKGAKEAKAALDLLGGFTDDTGMAELTI